MMKKQKIALLLTGFLLAMSCNDALELDPITEITEQELFSDPVEIENLLLGAYRPMGFEYIGDLTGQDTYVLPFVYTDARSDDAVVENYFFGGNKFHDFEHLPNMTPSNSMVRAVWIKFFTGIAKSNDIVGSLQNISDEVLDAGTRDLFLAEAKILRAYYYFEVVKNFGAAPIFDGPIDATDTDVLRRRPAEEVYALIERDLIESAEVLPLTQSDPRRATQGAALGLLSKVYLYQEKWQEAADAAQAVIDLGIYELEANFADNWRLDNEHGVESIWEIVYDDRTAFVFDSRQTSSLAAQLHSPSLTAPVLGWNYHLPGQELIAAFANEGDVIRRRASFIEEGTIFNSPILEAESLDPLPGGFTSNAAGINDPEGGTQYGLGYVYTRKYFLSPEDLNATTSNIQHSPLNQKILRYGEVLLILAEAVANGASGNGQEAFDQVRSRAGLASKPLSVEAIKLERRLELASEWNRFHDLVRWGDAAAEIDNFVAGRDELLPVPLDEILITGTDNTGGPILTQNPGY